MYNVMFIFWTRALPGGGKVSAALFAASVAFWNKHLAEGNIESFEPVILTPHGGPVNGFFLIKGEDRKLDEIRHSEEYLSLSVRLNLASDGYGTVTGYAGESLLKVVSRWGDQT